MATSPEAYAEIVERMATDRNYSTHLRRGLATAAPRAFNRLDGADALIDAILAAD